MKREIETLMRDFAHRGGAVVKAPEGKITVDWSENGKFRRLAKTVGKIGHKKRRRKK